MFNFLKKKLKDAVSVFSKKVEEEVEEEILEEPEEDVIEEHEDIEEESEEESAEERLEEDEEEQGPQDEKPDENEEESGKDEEINEEEKPKEELLPKKEKKSSSAKTPKPSKKEKKTKTPKKEKNIEEDTTPVGESSQEGIATDSAKKQEILEGKEQKSEVRNDVGKELNVQIEEKEEEQHIEEAEQEGETEEGPVQVDEEKPVEEQPKKGFFSRLRETFTGKAKEDSQEQEEKSDEEQDTDEEKPHVEEQKPSPAEQKSTPEKLKKQTTPKRIIEPPKEKEKEETIEEQPKKGFFSKIGDAITKKAISEDKFEELFWEIEVALLEGNVAVSVIEKIKDDLKEELVNKRVNRFEIANIIEQTLRSSIKEILSIEPIDILARIEQKEGPYVMCFVGVNGAGKTTTIGKFIKYLQENKLQSVVAAGDTFRAAALEQLETHATNLGVKLIKHDYGSDAAAVAFDAIKYAKQKQLDVVLVDTAGRLHSNTNLMNELQKVIRVSQADFVMFVGDSLTGNDAVEQAEKYNEIVGVDGITLAKADVDEKGGATISTSYVIKKPVMFLGVGQEYEDLEVFDPEKLLEKLGL